MFSVIQVIVWMRHFENTTTKHPTWKIKSIHKENKKLRIFIWKLIFHACDSFVEISNTEHASHPGNTIEVFSVQKFRWKIPFSAQNVEMTE